MMSKQVRKSIKNEVTALKRILALVMALAMLCALTGCVSDSERQARKEALNALNGSYGSYALNDGTTIEPIELFNNNDVIVKLVGIIGESDDIRLLFAVRNGTRKDINLSADTLLINGWSLSSYFDESTVKAHSVTMVSMSSMSGYDDCVYLKAAPVWSLGLDITMYNSDYDQIGSVNYSTYTSSYTGDENIEPLDGYTIVDESGILIRLTNMTTSESGTKLTMYAQNDSSRHIAIGTNRARLNGNPVEMWMWNGLVSGARYLDTERISEEDTYGDVVVSADDELTFNLEVSDYDNGTTLISKDITVRVGDLLELSGF